MSKHDWPLDIDPVYGCWIYRGKRDRDGYAITRAGKRAHTAVFVSEIGAIPEGNELDHECRRRACVNPAHLALVTRSENERRKAWRYRVRKTSCGRGHSLSLYSLITPEGGRLCRLCCKEPRP